MSTLTAEISARAVEPPPPGPPIEDDAVSRLRRQGLCGLSDLLSTRRGPDRREYLIEGLAGMRQIALLAGDSGLGKSPLLYQVTLSVAAGIECLGMPTKQAATLYMDFENTREDAATDIVQPMLVALGLKDPPPLWSAWYYLDSPANADPAQIVKEWLALPEHEGLPKLIVIDPYEAWPGASIKNENIRGVFRPFRALQRTDPLTVWFAHHINKEPTKQDDRDAMPDLANNPRKWLERTRGGKALINASDVRLGVEETGEEGLRLAGFRRGKGKIGPLYFTRHFNEDGDATHYTRASLVERLAADPLRSEEMTGFKGLPDSFRTADVKRAFSCTHNEQANRRVNTWKNEGLIRQVGRGSWQKTLAE